MIFSSAWSRALKPSLISCEASSFGGGYLRFLEVARGSACEVRSLLGLAARLRFLKEEEAAGIQDEADHVCRGLHATIESLGGQRE